MKILIITYDMIPYSPTWGGAQRMYYLAETLLSQGNEVNIICCERKMYGWFGHTLNAKLVPVEYKGILIKSKVADKKYENKSELPSKKEIIVNYAKSLIKKKGIVYKTFNFCDRIIYNEPNFMTGYIASNWADRSWNKIHNVLTNNMYDAVLLSGPPFGFWKIIKRIKTLVNCPIILDYRDPWNLWKKGSIFTKYKERKYLKYSDMVVFTNNRLRNDMIKEFHLERKKTEVVTNGYADENWNFSEKKFDNLQNNSDRLKIAYVGSITFDKTQNTYRDPSIFLRALEYVLSEGYNIEMVFVGVNDVNSPEVQLLKKKFGDDRIKFYGFIESKSSVKYMLEADALLLLHNSNDQSGKYIVSGKLYDYIKARKYILYIGNDDDTHQEIINSNNLGKTVKNNVNDIEETLIKLCIMKKNNSLTINDIDTTKYSRSYQNDSYINIIRKLVKTLKNP